jgi:hypothetical protein
VEVPGAIERGDSAAEMLHNAQVTSPPGDLVAKTKQAARYGGDGKWLR